MIVRLAATFALAIATSALVSDTVHAAEDAQAIAAVVNGAFRPLIRQHDVPGLAVGVTAGGRQHFFYYGTASKETGAPVTADTLFEIGSVSKMFTATLAAYAQAQGALSLSDHPGRFMPQLRGSAIDRASLLNLGTYTAGGLPLQFPAAVRTSDEMVAFFRAWKPSAPPGAERRYSNPSLGLLGHVTTLAMKATFTELMETTLLPKLGIRSCFVRVPQARMPDYAFGYRGGKAVRMGKAVFDLEAYGFRCNAAGLLRLVEANMRPGGLEPPMQRAVESTQVGYFEIGGMVQGFGWEQYPYPVALNRLLAGNATDMTMKPNAARTMEPPQKPVGPTLFNKTGSTGGFSAYAAFVPARDIGIVILANTALPAAPRVVAAHAVLEALAEKRH